MELQLKEVAEPIVKEIDQSMEALDTIETQTGEKNDGQGRNCDVNIVLHA